MQTIPKNLIKISRTLRRNQTPWEHKLWQHLRANRFYGIQFKRQVRLGNYIADFYCANKRLIIELDGGHHNQEQFKAIDASKEQYLRGQGYEVLRFWNNELDVNFSGVLERIRVAVLFNTPLPQGTAASPLDRRDNKENYLWANTGTGQAGIKFLWSRYRR